MATEATKGTELTRALRKAHRIGPRTRWNRDGWTALGNHRLRDDIVDRIDTATLYPGSYSDEVTVVLWTAVPVLRHWDKYVGGRRINSVQSAVLENISPWEWTALLGEMVDADLSNSAEAEMWFRARQAADVARYDEVVNRQITRVA